MSQDVVGGSMRSSEIVQCRTMSREAVGDRMKTKDVGGSHRTLYGVLGGRHWSYDRWRRSSAFVVGSKKSYAIVAGRMWL